MLEALLSGNTEIPCKEFDTATFNSLQEEKVDTKKSELEEQFEVQNNLHQ